MKCLNYTPFKVNIMTTDSNKNCSGKYKEEVALAREKIMLVDWAYYSGINNAYKESVAPEGVAGCIAYPIGEVPRLTNRKRTNGLIIDNPDTKNIYFVDLPNGALGEGKQQCDQITYLSEGRKTKWTLLIELKYSAPLHSSQGEEQFITNIQDKYNEAINQIDSTYKHIMTCKNCKKHFPKPTYGVVSFPLIPGICGQSESIRGAAVRHLKELKIKKLPQIVGSSIKISYLSREYSI